MQIFNYKKTTDNSKFTDIKKTIEWFKQNYDTCRK